MAQLAERLGLDLANPLAGHVELAADLLEGSSPAVLQPEPELEDAPLAAGQGVQDGLNLLLEKLMRRCLRRCQRAPVLDEVAEVRILFFADRRLERDRLLGDLDDLADLLRGDLDLLALRHRLGDLLHRRLPADADELALAVGELRVERHLWVEAHPLQQIRVVAPGDPALQRREGDLVASPVVDRPQPDVVTRIQVPLWTAK